ncbi:hypothetical protein GCK32_013676 [Trichostrongylus colubriformis]|uniref:Uncharacterized protein n=1 Tax=Trichostrongylus colubriformis TaxID=6319 RepID=A0AAN8G2M4_TRICO
MRRGLLDGRYRLLQQHHQHEEAVKWYRERQEDELNNHCTKGDCGACVYGFQCDCEQDVQSRFSRLHVHASLMYAPSGMVDDLM